MELAASIIVLTAVSMVAHELGHLAAARLCGVRAKELALGVGPRLCGFTIGRMSFNLRAFPLASFLRLDGLKLREKSILGQLCVHLGGVAFNAALGIAFFGTIFGWLNLAIAAGNLLPLYQHDGWKCGVVLVRALLRRESRPVEWVFTFSGLVSSLILGHMLFRYLS